MSVITLPAEPRPVPALRADPSAIAEYAASLLAASAQVDDLGTFVAGSARVADWQGRGGAAYHTAIAPVGRRADAMSLALRGVARRADAHAGAMTTLRERRADLVERRQHLVREVSGLRDRAAGASAEEAPAVQADCDRVARDVVALDDDVVAWARDVATEESEMTEALDRVMTLDQVERAYGGVPDPADAALGSRPPAGSPPEDVAAWWAGLGLAEQLAVLAASPGAVGNLPGVPAWARDAANRVALGRDLAEWERLADGDLLTDRERQWLDNARATREALDRMGERTDPVTGLPVETQLHLYDPAAFDGDGRVAIAAGDLDAADNVAVLVPGFGTDMQSAPYQGDRAATLHESTRFLDPAQTNATMFWIGYDAPDNLPWTGEGWDGAGVVGEDAATEGGERLADTVDGLRAGRDGDPAHLTVIGHSYGSTTTGHGAHDHGLDADDIVFVGSPGVGGDTDHAADTGLDPEHVWAAANSRDPITYLANHGWVHLESLGGAGLGDDPAEDDFGAQRIEAESTSRGDLPGLDQHSLYFDHDTEALFNISHVVNGSYDEVRLADHHHDPWWGGVQDPELDRDPTAPATR